MKFKLPEKYNSISFKTSLFTGVLIFISFSIIIVYTTLTFIDAEVQATQESLVASSREIASTVKVKIDKAFDLGRFTANMQKEAMKSAPNKLTREDIVAQLKNQLSNNSDILSTYTLWEPNAYDGKDSAYVNKPYHDATGRFIPYVVKSGEQIKIEPLMYYDLNTKDGEYYQVPKNTLGEMLVEPMWYPVDGKNVLMISSIVPIIADNKFLGITGSDFSVDFIQELVSGQNIAGGVARISVLSANGQIVAMKGHPENIAKKLSDLSDNYEKTFEAGLNEVRVYKKNGLVKVAVPIILGNTNTPWQVTVAVPEAIIKESAYALSWKLMIVGLLFIGGLLTFLVLFLNKMLNPVNNIITAAEKVVEGDLDYQLVDSESSEIKKLNRAFGKIISNQREITEVCASIATGDFVKKAVVKSDKDMLSRSVNLMIDNLKQASEEDKKRNWAAEGLARFAEILRADKDLKTLAESVMTNLVKYIGANQGWLFLVNDQDKNDMHLQLLACYAYNKKKFLEKRVEIGEGLVGQCYLEKDTILLTEVPGDYVTITSGIGSATPRCLLIVPLIVNENIEGVIELASFDKPESHVVQFIQKLAESIASAISSVKINQRTKQLLEISQQQTEEMRAQEEEMRQNMEELQATQEEVQRKEATYQEEIQYLRDKLEKLQQISDQAGRLSLVAA